MLKNKWASWLSFVPLRFRMLGVCDYNILECDSIIFHSYTYCKSTCWWHKQRLLWLFECWRSILSDTNVEKQTRGTATTSMIVLSTSLWHGLRFVSEILKQYSYHKILATSVQSCRSLTFLYLGSLSKNSRLSIGRRLMLLMPMYVPL